MTVRTLNEKPTPLVKTIQDIEGRLLTDSNDVLLRWKEYIEELYLTEKITNMETEEENEISADD